MLLLIYSPPLALKIIVFTLFCALKHYFDVLIRVGQKISIDRGAGPRETLRSRDGARHVTLPCGPGQVQSKTKPNGTGVKTLTFNPALPPPHCHLSLGTNVVIR